jgi:hypothetical protein
LSFIPSHEDHDHTYEQDSFGAIWACAEESEIKVQLTDRVRVKQDRVVDEV